MHRYIVQQYIGQHCGVQRYIVQQCDVQRDIVQHCGVQRYIAQQCGVQRYTVQRCGVQHYTVQHCDVQRCDCRSHFFPRHCCSPACRSFSQQQQREQQAGEGELGEGASELNAFTTQLFRAEERDLLLELSNMPSRACDRKVRGGGSTGSVDHEIQLYRFHACRTNQDTDHGICGMRGCI